MVSHSVFIVATWIAAVCGGIGIAAAFISAIVGYQLTEESLTKANERIVSAETQAKTEIAAARSDADAKIKIAREESAAEVAKANARSDEANARALEAQVALEKFKAPRIVKPEQGYRIADKLRVFSNTPFDMSVVVGDPEALLLMLQIVEILEAAGWKWIEFNRPNGPFMQVHTMPGKPNIGMIGAWAVLVQAHDETAAAFAPAMKALAAALDAEGVIAAAAGKPPAGIPNHDTVHIIIGKKP